MIRLLALTFLCSTLSFAASIQKVSFQQQGEVSQLVIELDRETFAERFHIAEDKQIILDVKNSSADPKVLRPIDTSEFNGSSVYISAYPKPGSPSDTRFAIQLRDNVQSRLNLEGNRIVLNIENRYGVFNSNPEDAADQNLDKPGEAQKVAMELDGSDIKKPRSNEMTDVLENVVQSGQKEYVGKRISINVKSIPVSDLLTMIGETAGFNIIIDDEAVKRPPISINLNNIPWDEALDTILNLSRLSATKSSNILSVTTIEKAVTERETEIKNQEKFKVQEPLVTKVFPISYAILDDIVTILKEYATERGKISKDERTNQLIVKDSVDSVEKMKKVIELLDKATPQVLIEAKIVEATEEFAKQLGFNGLRFGYNPLASYNPAANTGLFSLNSAPSINSPIFAGANVTLFKRMSDVNFDIRLMESENMGKVISSPKVITQNKQKATLTTSDQTSFVTQNRDATGTTTTTYATISAALALNVTPQITNEGSVAMQIDVTKESFKPKDPNSPAPPNKTNNKITTSVLVDNGSTVVIGGLYQQSKTLSKSGVPFLQDIPIIGWLFRTAYNPEERKNELMIFITPRIINQDEAGLSQESSL